MYESAFLMNANTSKCYKNRKSKLERAKQSHYNSNIVFTIATISEYFLERDHSKFSKTVGNDSRSVAEKDSMLIFSFKNNREGIRRRSELP